MQNPNGTYTLLGEVSSTGAGSGQYVSDKPHKSVQAVVSGTGAVTGTVDVEASNDGVNFFSIGTITLTGTGSASGGFSTSSAWAFIRANVTAITGTGAKITSIMAVA